MSSRREDHLQVRDESARRSLKQLERRWPLSPWVYLVALLIVLGLLALL